MVKKYFIDPESVAFKKGFENHLGKRDYMKPYSGRTQYGEYINYKAGIEQAKREIKMYGEDRVERYHRFQVCLSALGKTEEEIRKIIRLPDGNIYTHESNAILMKLFSLSSNGFNSGVHAVLYGDKRRCPYCKMIQYIDYVKWHDGVSSADLAVKLHGREAVFRSL